MAEEFENTKTKKTAMELSAFASESESDAQRRLQAMGWNFSGVDYEFADQKFKVKRDAKDPEPDGKSDD